jgi:hypothetical protein
VDGIQLVPYLLNQFFGFLSLAEVLYLPYLLRTRSTNMFPDPFRRNFNRDGDFLRGKAVPSQEVYQPAWLANGSRWVDVEDKSTIPALEKPET